MLILLFYIFGDDLVKFFRKGSSYGIRVVDDHGDPLDGGEVIYNIHGVFYNKTTKNGVAILDINLLPGQYIITAMHRGFYLSHTITVYSTLETNNTVFKADQNSEYKVRVYDGVGNPIANKEVSFNLEGRLAKGISDENGYVSVNFKVPAGKYLITSTYGELSQTNVIVAK